jgi:hypothetical protein
MSDIMEKCPLCDKEVRAGIREGQHLYHLECYAKKGKAGSQTQEVKLSGPDVSITIYPDKSIHFRFDAEAATAENYYPQDKAKKILGRYIETLEKDVAVLKEAKARIE